jgi:phosphohistidine phosphatase
MGDFLKDIGFRPDALLSSPKLRAHETAKLVSREVGRKVQLDKSLAESFGLSALEALLERHDAQRVMLVGHDPDFSTLVALLCGASRVPLKKGALARIDATRPVRPGSGELRWLVPPALIRKL